MLAEVVAQGLYYTTVRGLCQAGGEVKWKGAYQRRFGAGAYSARAALPEVGQNTPVAEGGITDATAPKIWKPGEFSVRSQPLVFACGDGGRVLTKCTWEARAVE